MVDESGTTVTVDSSDASILNVTDAASSQPISKTLQKKWIFNTFLFKGI